MKKKNLTFAVKTLLKNFLDFYKEKFLKNVIVKIKKIMNAIFFSYNFINEKNFLISKFLPKNTIHYYYYY